MHQDSIDIEILLQVFNTHGTEIAPGSDVIGEDLQFDRLVHIGSPKWLTTFWSFRGAPASPETMNTGLGLQGMDLCS
jgi:hypothetical protein